MKWNIGCSGFHYKEWKGMFYPEKLPQRQWFEYYSSKFNTLELNVTFYRFPQLSFLENWYAKSPDHFIFSVKVPRLVTHYKQLRDTEQLLQDFYNTIRQGLRDKLGPVLFQFPPQYKYTDERLLHITKSVDLSFENVVEFRNAGWWKKEVKEELGRNTISFCGISYPGLPNEPVINTPVVYYRFHGVPTLYHSPHNEEEIREMALVFQKNEQLKKAYVYFNNTAGPAAIQNAVFLENLVLNNNEHQKKQSYIL